MIDYNDPADPNYDPYWVGKETSHRGPAACPDLSDHELEELGETYIKKMREEGLLRPTLVRPGKDGPEAEMKSQADQSDGEASF
jgi:hypothetical protein